MHWLIFVCHRAVIFQFLWPLTLVTALWCTKKLTTRRMLIRSFTLCHLDLIMLEWEDLLDDDVHLLIPHREITTVSDVGGFTVWSKKTYHLRYIVKLKHSLAFIIRLMAFLSWQWRVREEITRPEIAGSLPTYHSITLPPFLDESRNKLLVLCLRGWWTIVVSS